MLKHGYSIDPLPQNTCNVMTSFPSKVVAMVIHSRYAHGNDIVINASLIRNGGTIEPQFDEAYFSVGPVICWLAKSKAKPVVSCLKHDMTQHFSSHPLSQPNPSFASAFSQSHNLSQPLNMSQPNPSFAQAFSQSNNLSQPLNHSNFSQYNQFSQHH